MESDPFIKVKSILSVMSAVRHDRTYELRSVSFLMTTSQSFRRVTPPESIHLYNPCDEDLGLTLLKNGDEILVNHGDWLVRHDFNDVRLVSDKDFHRWYEIEEADVE